MRSVSLEEVIRDLAPQPYLRRDQLQLKEPWQKERSVFPDMGEMMREMWSREKQAYERRMQEHPVRPERFVKA